MKNVKAWVENCCNRGERPMNVISEKACKEALFLVRWRHSFGGHPLGLYRPSDWHNLGHHRITFDVGQSTMRDTLQSNVWRTLVIVMLLLTFNARSGPADEIWDGGGVNNNINTPENWDDDTLPALTGGTANLVFAGSTRPMPLINVPISPLTIRFDTNASPFTLQGASNITTGTSNANGNIYNASSATQTIGTPLLLNRGTFFALGGDLVFNGSVNVGNGSNASGRSLTIDGDHDVYMNGPIEGTGTTSSSGGVISKLGSGTWYINSNNPLWAGRIGIDEGVLRISAADALGDPNSRTLVQGGGATGKSRLELAGNVTFAPERLELTGRDTGSSPVHLRNFSDNNIWTGDAVLLAGGAEYGFESASGKLTVTGNVVNRTGNATARTVRFSGVADGEFAGQFLNDTGTGALAIRKEGAGKWSFTNPLFSYAGDTLIQGGSLAFASGFSLGNSPNIQIASSATLETMDGNLILGSSQSLVGAGTVRGNAADFGSTITPDVPGTANSPATLTFANHLSFNGGGTIRMDLGNMPAAGGTSDLVEVGGNLAFAGTTTIAITPVAGGLASGTYRLMNYAGSLSGDASNLQLSMLSPIRQIATVDTAAPHQVNLVVTGAAANLVWTGDGGLNLWDVNTSVNWTRRDRAQTCSCISTA